MMNVQEALKRAKDELPVYLQDAYNADVKAVADNCPDEYLEEYPNSAFCWKQQLQEDFFNKYFEDYVLCWFVNQLYVDTDVWYYNMEEWSEEIKQTWDEILKYANTITILTA